VEAGGEPGLWGDGDLGATVDDGVEDAVGGVLGGGRDDGGGRGEGEPAILFFLIADEAGLDVGAGAHEAGADGGDADAFVAKFGVEAFGEAYEGEFAGGVGQHVGHGEFAADGSYVDDGGAGGVGFGVSFEHVGEDCVGGVEGGEEVGGHSAAVGGEGLVFDGADLDDAGVIDEDVDAAEVLDGMIDEAGGLGGVGEVGGDEEDVVGGEDGLALEEQMPGSGEFLDLAGGEDEFGAGSAEALGYGEAQAARASGDDYDLFAAGGAGHEGPGCCRRSHAGEDLEGGGGLLHRCPMMLEWGDSSLFPDDGMRR